jgi:2-polyprenyl-3-methyl-5-hydroxy-6-metoxy-1,4-benzoquinol methylase
MSQNPLASPEPWSLVATRYQEETVSVFRQYCGKTMKLAAYRPGTKVLDVACGPGTLSLMLADSAATVTARF